MRSISKEVYTQIQKDMPTIEHQLEFKEGSEALWRVLRTKYSILIPGIMAHIKLSGKIMYNNDEPDYRPELIQLKEAMLTYLIIRPIEGQINDEINNKADDLINIKYDFPGDIIINELIEESKIYMRSKKSSRKQIGLEKIWDAFERLKTIYAPESDKKQSVQKLISTISHDSKTNEEVFDTEFKELTQIGNKYQIRHFEKGKKVISSDDFREYLYFRLLSLISYSIQTYKEK